MIVILLVILGSVLVGGGVLAHNAIVSGIGFLVVAASLLVQGVRSSRHRKATAHPPHERRGPIPKGDFKFFGQGRPGGSE